MNNQTKRRLERNLREKANRRGWIFSEGRFGGYTLVRADGHGVLKIGAPLEDIDDLLARRSPYQTRMVNRLVRRAITAKAIEKLSPRAVLTGSMRNREYTWRFTKSVFKRLVRNTHRNEMLEQLHTAGRAAVYAGLVAYARSRTKRNGEKWDAAGWAGNAFEEIFGDWPRRPDRRGEFEPDA